MKLALAHILVFFYIYSINFSFIPNYVSTRQIYAILGIIIFMLKIITHNSVIMHKRYIIYLFSAFLLMLTAFITIAYNQTSDLSFFVSLILLFVTFFSSYFVINVLIRLGYTVDFNSISTLIINVIVIQSIIALAMYLFPSFSGLISQIEGLNNNELDFLNQFNDFRILGFGIRFFGAGVISGFGLILIAVLIKINDYPVNKIVYLTIKFILILIIGMMMARTTLIGAIIALLFILTPKNGTLTLKYIKRLFNFFSTLIILPILILIMLSSINNNFKEKMEPVFNFAFELFINYFNRGNLETESTDHLKEMYILPSNIDTWLIGDGYWLNPVGIGYYMSTDVGYLRLIYFFGIFGLLLFLLVNYFSINLLNNSKYKKQITAIFMLYLLILNFKGYIDITSFTLLLSMSTIIPLRKKLYQYSPVFN